MKSVKVKSRKEPFVDKTRTKIWQESAADPQGYIADHACCHGYSTQSLLEEGYSQTDMTFLLLKGELPSRLQLKLLDALSVALCNPGPRHPATRAVMESAVSKTHSHHFLPIGLMLLGGDKAAGSVESVMRYLRLNKRKRPAELAQQALMDYSGPENDLEIAPGFGPHFEQRELYFVHLAQSIQSTVKGDDLIYLNWSLAFDESLADSANALKATALAAAVFLDLGFHPRVGPGLFQLLSAPGLLAHGIEMMSQPISAMPFVADENYHFIDES